MGLYQRRRPAPIKIVPRRVRRQVAPVEEPEEAEEAEGEEEEEEEEEGPESPDSPFTSPESSPDSVGPDSPSTAGTPPPEASLTLPSLQAPAAQTGVIDQGDPAAAEPSVTSLDGAAVPLPTEVREEQTTAAAALPTSSATSSSSASSTAPSSSSASAESSAPTESSSASAESSASSAAASSAAASSASSQASSSTSEITSTSSSQPTTTPIAQSTTGFEAHTNTGISSTATSSDQAPLFSGRVNRPTDPSETPQPTGTDTPPPPQAELAGESTGIGRGKDGGDKLSKGAEAALITSAVLGFVALLIGAFFLYKRRRRQREEAGMRHAEDAFNPNNSGSLHAPETIHIGFANDQNDSHATKSSAASSSLFGGAYSVSSNPQSRAQNLRIQPPQPTPNPFADPPLNKAYDQLRGRPRSTTLTDRGSWVQNPFKDPESDRFDPFGELQEKARMERIKYMKELRREEDEARRREREQEFLEKERMGLDVPGVVMPRKGSGVTVEGVGVLDRSASGRYR